MVSLLLLLPLFRDDDYIYSRYTYTPCWTQLLLFATHIRHIFITLIFDIIGFSLFSLPVISQWMNILLRIHIHIIIVTYCHCRHTCHFLPSFFFSMPCHYYCRYLCRHTPSRHIAIAFAACHSSSSSLIVIFFVVTLLRHCHYLSCFSFSSSSCRCHIEMPFPPLFDIFITFLFSSL